MKKFQESGELIKVVVGTIATSKDIISLERWCRHTKTMWNITNKPSYKVVENTKIKILDEKHIWLRIVEKICMGIDDGVSYEDV